MIGSEINKLILDKIGASDAPKHIKKFVEEILKFESSHFDEFESGGVHRYSKAYENLLNKYVQDQIDADRDE